MPAALCYTCDTFLSYAYVDDLPVAESQQAGGWVSTFYETLAREVRQRLGRTDVALWKDDELAYDQSLTRQLIEKVQSAAVLIVMLSPGYIRSEWCGRERQWFMQAVRSCGNARVFVVAKEWIAPADVPAELRDYKRFPFCTGDERDCITFGYPRPNLADERSRAAFYDNIIKLSREIAAALKKAQASPAPPPPLSPPPQPGGNDHPERRLVQPPRLAPARRVFLAETTDDLEGERDMVRAFLDQHGIDVLPAAGVYYPTAPDGFRAAVEQDLQGASVFVQLLGGIPGRRPTTLPQGYPWLQWKLAKSHAATGRLLPILQWCSLALDISAVKDEPVMAFLRTDTVRQESLVDFQRSILAALEPPKNDAPQSNRAIEPDERPKLVCVNVDSSDRMLAEQIQSILRRERIEFISVLFGGSAPDNRELLENGLKECDGLIVIYGEAKDSWVDRQLLECRKSRAFRDRPFAALGIFEGPPPDRPGAKPPINVYLDGLEQYDCRGAPIDANGLERGVQAFLDRLRLNVSVKAA